MIPPKAYYLQTLPHFIGMGPGPIGPWEGPRAPQGPMARGALGPAPGLMGPGPMPMKCGRVCR